jgi:hypothetical protein
VQIKQCFGQLMLRVVLLTVAAGVVLNNQVTNSKEKKGPRAKERKEIVTVETGFKVRPATAVHWLRQSRAGARQNEQLKLACSSEAPAEPAGAVSRMSRRRGRLVGGRGRGWGCQHSGVTCHQVGPCLVSLAAAVADSSAACFSCC